MNDWIDVIIKSMLCIGALGIVLSGAMHFTYHTAFELSWEYIYQIALCFVVMDWAFGFIDRILFREEK